MPEEQAQSKHKGDDEDTHGPDAEPKPEEEEEQQEEGGDEEGALDEESLPSTLFYGVRGQQARPAHQCSAVSDSGPSRSAVQCNPVVKELLGGNLSRSPSVGRRIT